MNKQGQPHCFVQGAEPDGYVNISFDPGFDETLSPVSSAPQCVCLCNSNGKPQCANISYIFTNTSVYRGETITLPACIVALQLERFMPYLYIQILTHNETNPKKLVINSEKCVPFKYIVYSKRDYCCKHHLCQYLA